MINLLPQREKEILWQEKNWRLILILGALFLISLLSFSLILFSIKIYLQSQVNSQKILADVEEKQVEISEIQNLKTEITILNQNLSKLNSFYQNQLYLTEIFKKITKALPSEIYLTNFSYQKATLQVSLSGFAPSREILLKFKENLESEKKFGEIYFPPQNWLKPTDINFFLTFKVNY